MTKQRVDCWKKHACDLGNRANPDLRDRLGAAPVSPLHQGSSTELLTQSSQTCKVQIQFGIESQTAVRSLFATVIVGDLN